MAQICTSHTYSPQEDHDWDVNEWNSEEVLAWDGHSEGRANAWSWWNWSSWKDTKKCSWHEAQTTRIKAYEEAPPLFPEPVLAWLVLSGEKVKRREREKQDMIQATTMNRYQEAPSMRMTTSCQGLKKDRKSQRRTGHGTSSSASHRISCPAALPPMTALP